MKLELEYTGSAEKPAEYPRWDLPEVAIAGRSNCGKSSLLNTVSGQRSLARVSKTPGRTQRVHFFRGRAGLALVDLPGYGFALASNEIRARLSSAADSYLTTRENLRALVLVMDVRRDPEREERMLAELAASRELELILVATKIDKLGRADRERRMRALPSALAGPWLEFSSLDRTGADDLVRAIERLAGGRRR